jgi:cytosine/adenosine deaminase-related metal-dependent hydrolase
MNHPALFNRAGDAILDSLIFAARGNGVENVWRRGNRVVSAGRHVARDRIAARYRTALSNLLGRETR